MHEQLREVTDVPTVVTGGDTLILLAPTTVSLECLSGLRSSFRIEPE